VAHLNEQSGKTGNAARVNSGGIPIVSLYLRRDIGLRQFDFDIHTGSKIELHQRVYGLWRGLHNVEQPLIGTNFELLARLFVDVRSAVHCELFDTGRKWNWTTDKRASAACGVCDIASTCAFEAGTTVLKF
jgi:hypothetical protein